MNREVKDLEKSIDLLKTAGKDIHSDKWKRCVEHVKSKGGSVNAYAVCTAQLGEESFKSFAKSDELSDDEIRGINIALLKDASVSLEASSLGVGDESDIVDLVVNERFYLPEENVLFSKTLDMLYGEIELPKREVFGDSMPELFKRFPR